MPCHNDEKYLRDAIESVINQTVSNWELLIIDDNSTDNSVSIIKSYIKEDPRIKLLINEQHTGLPATPRNIGIRNANGRFIAFLDSDDKWLSSKLEKQLPLFSDNKCAVVFSYYRKMNESGIISDKQITSPQKVNYKKLLKGDCIGNLTGIYDIKKVGKIYQKEIHAEDYLMWLEILKKGFIAKNTNTVEALYRVRATSTSGNKIKSAIWNWNIYKNEIQLNFIQSIYYFLIYAIKSTTKYVLK